MKQKRYFQEGPDTIVDKAGDDGNWIYYFYNSDLKRVTFFCKNPEIKFHTDAVEGDEAVKFWDGMLDRVNNKNHPYYYV